MTDCLKQNVDAAVANHGFPTLLAWAEEGDRKAQNFIAVAYLTGTVVPKNFDAAGKWSLRAANQEVAGSQYLTGMMRKGDITDDLRTVEPSLMLAYMWVSLAAAQGHQRAGEERDRLQGIMPPELVQRAQTLAAAWRPCRELSCKDREPDPCTDRDPQFCLYHPHR